MKRKRHNHQPEPKFPYDRSVLGKDLPLEADVAKELRILFRSEPRKRNAPQDAMSYRLPGSIGTGKRR